VVLNFFHLVLKEVWKKVFDNVWEPCLNQRTLLTLARLWHWLKKPLQEWFIAVRL